MNNPGGAPRPTNTPQNNVSEKKLYKAALVDTTELVEKQARDDADHAMTESKEDREAGKLKKWWNRMWKHNIAEPFHRQRAMNEARKKILETKNLYANEEGNRGQKGNEEAMNAIISRFTSDCKEDMLREEERSSLKAPIVGNAQINSLIKSFANGTIDEAAFNTQKKNILSSLDTEYTSNEKLYADNLLKIATEVRDKYNHSKKLDDLDVDVELTLGKAKERLNTEAKLHGFDKIWNKFKKTGIGKRIGNEAAASLIGAGIYSVGRFFGLKALRSKFGQWMTFGGTAVVSAEVARQNERIRLEKERAQHSREMAKGKVFADDMKRRLEMQESNYQTRGAKEIISNLEMDLAKISSGQLQGGALQAALQNLADIESRIKLGDSRKIDLVAYSRFDQVETESTQIDLLRAKMKVALRHSNPDAELQLGALTHDQMQVLQNAEGGIDAKDKVFKKMKRSKSWAKFGKTLLWGSLFSFGAHELVNTAFPTRIETLLSEGYKHTAGMTKGWFHGKGVFGGWNSPDIGLRPESTPALSLVRFLSNEHARMPLGEHPTEFICGDTHLQLPEGVQIVDNHNDTYTILRDGQPVLENTKMYFENGDLAEETKKLFASHDIYTSPSLTSGPGSQTALEYVKTHASGLHKIHRELWYDNDTPKFDQNELRGWWGGVHNTGVDEHGNYVFNMSHMKTGGSFHGDQSVDAPEQIKNHGLKMLFSISRNTQNNVFEIPIDEHGNAIIPKDSELAKLFTVDAKGHAVFMGKYAEVAEQTGVAKDGGEIHRILATHVGPKQDFVFPGSSPVSNIRLDIPEDNDIDVPPFLYVGSRQPLERGKNGEYVSTPKTEVPPKVPLEDKKPTPKAADELKGLPQGPENAKKLKGSESLKGLPSPNESRSLETQKKENKSKTESKKKSIDVKKIELKFLEDRLARATELGLTQDRISNIQKKIDALKEEIKAESMQNKPSEGSLEGLKQEQKKVNQKKNKKKKVSSKITSITIRTASQAEKILQTPAGATLKTYSFEDIKKLPGKKFYVKGETDRVLTLLSSSRRSLLFKDVNNKFDPIIDTEVNTKEKIYLMDDIEKINSSAGTP